jgi:hypothetical protein
MNVTDAEGVQLHEEKLVLTEDTIAENGFWFAPECADCFLCNKFTMVEEKVRGHSWKNVHLTYTGHYISFPSSATIEDTRFRA